MLRISRLSFKGCNNLKDIPNLSVQKNGLIFCDNLPVYETSVIDVIERLLSGKHDSLRDIVFGSGPSSGVPRELEAAVEFGGEQHIISSEKDLGRLPQNIRNACMFFKQSNKALKFFPLHEFATAEPEERFEFVSQFVNLTSYIDFEKVLEILTAPTDRLLAKLTSRINHCNSLLASTLETENRNNSTDYIHDINVVLSKSGFESIGNIEELDETLSVLNQKIENWMNSSEYIAINELKAAVKKFNVFNTIFELWAKYSDSWSSLRYKELEMQGSFYEEVLVKGIEWIETDDLKECPLCGNDIEIAELKAELARRIETNLQLIKLREDFSQTAKEFCEKIKELTISLTVINEKCKTLEVQNPLSAFTVHLQQFTDKLSDPDSVKVFMPILNNIYKEKVESDLRELKKSVSQKAEHISADKKLKELKDSANKLSKTHDLLQEISEANIRIEALLNQKRSDRRINNIAVKARKNVVEKLLRSIAKVSDELLENIFSPPEKNGKKSRNNSDFNTESSITLYSIGLNDDRSALPEYFENSIMPVIGLCIFLAARKIIDSRNEKFPILLIDKALDCIPEDYIEPTAKMMIENFLESQMFISTSDLKWVKALTKQKSHNGIKLAVKFDSLALYSQYRKLG